MVRKTVLITGVPGTGKTTLASSLSKKTDAALLDINKLVNVLGLHTHTDETDGAKVVRMGQLQDELCAAIKAEKRSIVLDGHLGCEMKLPVQKVIVLRCDPKELRLRLSTRNYSPEKTASNALSEALDYCVALSEKNFSARKVWEIDTTGKTPAQVLGEAEKIISGKKRKKEHYSFPDALLREAITGEKIRKVLGS